MVENVITDKGTIEPINDEQRLAVKEITEFLKKGDPNEWLVLEGKAGTGKTTIISKVLEPFITKKRIEICALSHKAKKVLWDKMMMGSIEPPIGLASHSVAGLLGMTLNLETGKFTKAFQKKKPPIRWADIIIVDEASMINEEALIHIMDSKKPKAKVIFIGDIGQLPPIREQNDPSNGTPSPIFLGPNKVKLINRVRQSEDSEILPYSDYYWENSVVNDGEEEDPVPITARVTSDQLVFSRDIDKVLQDNKQLFLDTNKTNDPNLVKVIVYRNKTKKSINWFIRNMIYETPKEYELGDLLIFNDNYFKGDAVIMENSTEVSVKHIKQTTFYGEYHGYKIRVSDGEKTETIDVLSEVSRDAWNKHVSELFDIAKKSPFGVIRTRALRNAWNMRNKFANIDYAYTLTSHKSQGSTYGTVIVVEDDILEVGMIDNVEKSQAMYVAITRASDRVHIVSELN
jgi:exodeoxyribonuclease-5